MKKKKAIYFNGEYNPVNPAGGAQCITYDETDGFQFIDGDKVITVPTTTDKSQNETITAQAEMIKTLQEQIKFLTANAAEDGKFIETIDGTKVVTISNITTTNCNQKGNDVLLIQAEGVSKPITKSVTIVANNVTAKNVTIDATAAK